MRWREVERTKYGNQQWETGDGMFRLVCITQCQGIPMRREYVLWQFKRGSWFNVAERRSHKAIEKIAAQRAEQLESDEE